MGAGRRAEWLGELMKRRVSTASFSILAFWEGVRMAGARVGGLVGVEGMVDEALVEPVRLVWRERG